MIDLKNKQEILLMYFREGKSQRSIAKEVGIDRKTVSSYIKDYENKLEELNEQQGPLDKGELIQSIVEEPKYKRVNRTKRVLTDEIEERILSLLQENELKRQQGLHKQTKKIIDIHEVLEQEGFNISYTTVRNKINEIARKAKEAYIKGSYLPGGVCEFDWGEVKIVINGKRRTLQLAVFTSAFGNYRMAYLFTKQKTECFQEAHALFFDQVGGVFQTMIYDNMRVAVKKFVGTEKEPTEALLKLSIYYMFQFRFCNVQRGNEKGHVERSVEVIRRKAFAFRETFETLEEANQYLLEVCHKLNRKPIKQKENKTAEKLLELEKEKLLPIRPAFDAARINHLRVDKYSTVMVDQSRYSVPDHLVGEKVKVKVYSTKIQCFYQEEKMAEHHRLTGCHEWSLQLEHYVKTLKKKPGALADSAALQQATKKIKNIYENYYTKNPRGFVELIELIKDGTALNQIEQSINELRKISPQHVTTDKIKVLCEKKQIEINNTPLLSKESLDIQHYAEENLRKYDALFQTQLIGSKEAIA
ncbi:MAG: IS21 family transposase [Bacillaceae bacterium]|nr:IS21 family transposase [Bacillaceae bacterium]